MPIGRTGQTSRSTVRKKIDISSTIEAAEPEHHWYSRVLHPFGGGANAKQVTSRVTVRIAEDNGGTRISVEGDSADKGAADAARRVVQILRERLS